MVRGVNGINLANKMGNFLLKGKAKGVGKATELPAKVVLGALGAIGIANSIKAPNTTDKFVMKCSDYEPVDYCSPLFP